MMKLLESLHHRDSHPSGPMSSRLSALRMTPSLLSFRGALRRGIPMINLLDSIHHGILTLLVRCRRLSGVCPERNRRAPAQNDTFSLVIPRSIATRNPYDQPFGFYTSWDSHPSGTIPSPLSALRGCEIIMVYRAVLPRDEFQRAGS